jgi:UPF0271 protein
MNCIDLNCDVAEIPEMAADGSQAELLRYISSANVACGAHAGNAEMMRATIEQAQAAGAAIGAHPGYEDRENFGRVELRLSPEEIAASVHRQVVALDEIADSLGSRILHVKPHGALYNLAARDVRVAQAIAEGVSRWSRDVILIGLAGSVMIAEFRKAKFRVAAEAFADRRYENNGTLRSRKFEDAILRTPEEAAGQAVAIVRECCVISSDGKIVPLDADTICVHGDTPSAVEIARAIDNAFHAAGIVRKRLVLHELH